MPRYVSQALSKDPSLPHLPLASATHKVNTPRLASSLSSLTNTPAYRTEISIQIHHSKVLPNTYIHHQTCLTTNLLLSSRTSTLPLALFKVPWEASQEILLIRLVLQSSHVFEEYSLDYCTTSASMPPFCQKYCLFCLFFRFLIIPLTAYTMTVYS